VTGASETSLTLDANHPLAGKDLTFEIEVMSIVS
jgi:peptidylprolyl isomerase